ncbi:uncharacterized protein LOC141756199 isoform X2 [Sebastes fasciatus]|uniref:uncharacterized protein LOC141756199 isoform X2 n=1 Tax=Sebastes fasciatus TaxID=394691 RepID=UPI003D9F1AB2
MDVSTSPNAQISTLHSDPLCGSCPSSGSAPQANSLWPSLPQSGAGFPGWPGQPGQLGQPAQPAPCWNGQPNTPCWPGTQPGPVSVPAPQAVAPAPAPTTTVVQAPANAQVPPQPCNPCWGGTQYQPPQNQAPQYQPPQNQAPQYQPPQNQAPQYQPPQNQAPQYQSPQYQTPQYQAPQYQSPQYQAPQYQPPQYQPPQYQPLQPSAPIQAQVPVQVPVQVPAPAPTLTPHPVPAPAPGIRPNAPGWPAHPGWPYNPGQSGWPGQNPSIMPPHWLPPTSGPLSVPYNLNLARGVYDKMMMTILGHVKPNAKMFTVNFLRGNDIALHINPRFSEGGKQALIRNHKLGERWGAEERDLKGPFPFAQGSPFEANVWKKMERVGKSFVQAGPR